MEFLKALKQAKDEGIPAEQFLPIWQSEVKLQQQKEEVRLQELKMNQSQGVDPKIFEQFKQQKEEMAQLKSEVLVYNQAILQIVRDISTWLSPGSPVNLPQAPQPGKVQDGNPSAQGSDLSHQPAGINLNDVSKLQASNSKYDETKPGVLFQVLNVQQMLVNQEERSTVLYSFPSCPYNFRLCVYFNAKNRLCFSIVVAPLKDVDVSTINPISLCGKGYILNKSSNNYSQIFDFSIENNEACRNIVTDKEIRIHANSSLKTGTTQLFFIKLTDLQARNFLFDNSFYIRWYVEPFSVVPESLTPNQALINGSSLESVASNKSVPSSTSDNQSTLRETQNAENNLKPTQKNSPSKKKSKKALKSPTKTIYKPSNNVTYKALKKSPSTETIDQDDAFAEFVSSENEPENPIVPGFQPTLEFTPFPESGDLLTITNISDLLASESNKQLTQMFSLPHCPCVFRLCLSFSTEKELKVEMILCRIKEGDMKWPILINTQGYILSKSSNDFSALWDVEAERKLKKFKLGSEKQFLIPVGLKSASGDVDKVQFGHLKMMDFLTDDSLTLKWFVSAKSGALDLSTVPTSSVDVISRASVSNNDMGPIMPSSTTNEFSAAPNNDVTSGTSNSNRDTTSVVSNSNSNVTCGGPSSNNDGTSAPRWVIS